MQLDLKPQANSTMSLTISLSPEEFAPFRQRALLYFQAEIEVPGFRAGKAPLDLLEQHIKPGALEEKTLDLAVSETYAQALKEKKLSPLDYPKIEIQSVQPLEYKASFPVYPEVKLKSSFKNLKLQRNPIEIKENEVLEVLKQLADRSTTWTSVSRSAKMSDRVEIDFQGSDEAGEHLEGTHSKNYPLVLGSKAFIPGFEEALVGMNVGEEKTFEVRFPKDYFSDQFKDKKVNFWVKVHMIEEPQVPELDDAFAEKMTQGQHKDLKSFKVEIESQLKTQKTEDDLRRLEEEFAEQLKDHVEAEVPEVMVQREVTFLKEYLEKDLARQKKTLQSYEEELHAKGKHLDDELLPQAKKQILIRLGLETLYESEKIEVSEEDIQTELDSMGKQYPPEFRETLMQQYAKDAPARQRLENVLRLKKLVQLFTEEAPKTSGKANKKASPSKKKKE